MEDKLLKSYEKKLSESGMESLSMDPEFLGRWLACVEKVEQDNPNIRGGVACIGPGSDPKVLLGGKSIIPLQAGLVQNRKELKQNFRKAVKSLVLSREETIRQLAGTMYRWIADTYIPTTLENQVPEGNLMVSSGPGIDAVADVVDHFYDIVENGPVFVDGWRGFLPASPNAETAIIFPIGINIMYAEDLPTVACYRSLGVSHAQLLEALRQVSPITPLSKVLIVVKEGQCEAFIDYGENPQEVDPTIKGKKVERHTVLEQYVKTHLNEDRNNWSLGVWLWNYLHSIYGNPQWLVVSNILILAPNEPMIFTHTPVTVN